MSRLHATCGTDIYEVRADGDGQVLLALEAFSNKTQKTPPAKIDQAERRLVEWRKRGTQS